MNGTAKGQFDLALLSIRTFFKWLVAAAIIGAVGGLVGCAFHLSVEAVTKIRIAFPWLLWFLPIAGVCIAGIYRLTQMEAKNTNAIIDSIHFGDKVPILLVPVIFVSTVITHLFGGSAGREGAALQIGGSLGSNFARLFRFDDKDRRLATLCGMSAVFAALFGTPLTATVFALEVISVGVVYYSGFVPCIVASLAAYTITGLFSIAPTSYTIAVQALHAALVWRVALLAVACALVSILFCEVMHRSENTAARFLPNPYIRAFVGGLVILVLTWLLETPDYNGAGMDMLRRALEDGSANWDAAFWKLIFTAVTLACGFKGGEVVPTFFIGATFGCVFGSLLGIPPSFAAAIGLVAVFCGNVNCPIASIILSVELFGSENLIYYALACGVSYMLSGYNGLYKSQKIMYSKLRAEFIDINAR